MERGEVGEGGVYVMHIEASANNSLSGGCACNGAPEHWNTPGAPEHLQRVLALVSLPHVYATYIFALGVVLVALVLAGELGH